MLELWYEVAFELCPNNRPGKSWSRLRAKVALFATETRVGAHAGGYVVTARDSTRARIYTPLHILSITSIRIIAASEKSFRPSRAIGRTCFYRAKILTDSNERLDARKIMAGEYFRFRSHARDIDHLRFSNARANRFTSKRERERSRGYKQEMETSGTRTNEKQHPTKRDRYGREPSRSKRKVVKNGRHQT